MPAQILTDEDIELLNKGLDLARQLRLELQRAKQAGLDVTDIEQELTKAEQQLRVLKRIYGTRR